MIVQIIRLQSSLQEEEVVEVAYERAEQFKEVPGLMQKYYVKTGEPNGYAGIYVWDSLESMKAFRESDLAATIPSAYKLQAPPNIEILQGVFKLRD